MKIGKYPVKHSYKLARIISDVLSLVIAYLIIKYTVDFFAVYKPVTNYIAKDNWDYVYKHGYWLAYRQYFVLIFPALGLGVFAAYLILVLKSHKFAKYNVTKRSAQAVYDWYAFMVSLCKLPLLMFVFETMCIFISRMLNIEESLLNIRLILYLFIIVIIARLSVHRIRALTGTEKTESSTESGGVKAKIVDTADDEEKTDDQ